VLSAQRVHLLYDQLLVKEPGTPTPLSWHQDGASWPLEGDQAVSLWMAMDPVTVATGGVVYARGQHRGPRYGCSNNVVRPGSVMGESADPCPDFSAVDDGALLLSWAAPWAITPLLMAGGAFLCFEGAEKVYEIIWPHAAEKAATGDVDPVEMENNMVNGAIRTDLILSGEIMAITLADVADKPILEQGAVLAVVGLGITALVYGFVAVIVKADDVGYALARRPGKIAGPGRALGRLLVTGMPPFLKFLAGIGTAAMLWVGGGIFLHGMEEFGLHEPAYSIHALSESAAASAGGALGWLVGAAGSGVFGLLLGGVIVAALHLWPRRAGH
jgi:predicted DNA repair protein MutK